jgi:hypothetical protein
MISLTAKVAELANNINIINQQIQKELKCQLYSNSLFNTKIEWNIERIFFLIVGEINNDNIPSTIDSRN